jgi:hypothetical protein
MKKSFALVFFLFTFCCFSQKTTTLTESFEIINNSAPDQSEFYTQSILNSNLEPYRLKDKRVTLKFKNGFSLVLLSAKELFVKGLNINMNSYKELHDTSVPLPIFSVTPNGWIGAEIQNQGNIKNK